MRTYDIINAGPKNRFLASGRIVSNSGRLIQVQNLPRNYLSDLALARELLRDGEYELFELLFASVPDVLSQLIRTTLIPSDGCTFAVADFSAIEARVIAWLAGEQWRLDVFATHGKIYEASASQMFKIPLDEVSKEDRQRGKVAELACIARGQLVLTDRGLVPIEDVISSHKVWDGNQWVYHDGVIARGTKEVFTYDGLTATADHLVWIEGESEPVRFDYAAAIGAHLVRSGDDGEPVWPGRNYMLREKVRKGLATPESIDTLHGLRGGILDSMAQSDEWSLERLSNVFTASYDPEMVGSAVNGRQTEMHQSERRELRKLRRSGNSIQFQFSTRGGLMDTRQLGTAGSGNGVGQNRDERSLRARESAVRTSSSQSMEPEAINHTRLEPERMALCSIGCNSETVGGTISTRNYRRSTSSGHRQAKELEANSREARVYDILNAGPNNRFTVSDRLVHNCGYQGGPNALIQMGALDKGLKEEDLQGIIDAWREANPAIKKFWYAVGDAAVKAVEEQRTVKLKHGISFIYTPGTLFCQLPSGRRLAYFKPRLEDGNYGKKQLSYEGVNDKKQWVRLRTYGGKLVENIVQAVARDCLAESMIRLDEAGHNIVMHVHDECILDEAAGSLEQVCEIMGQPISWAPGLPLRADGYETEFYKKD